jgi:hypothetical protein
MVIVCLEKNKRGEGTREAVPLVFASSRLATAGFSPLEKAWNISMRVGLRCGPSMGEGKAEGKGGEIECIK